MTMTTEDMWRHSLFFFSSEQAVQAADWIEEHVEGVEEGELIMGAGGRVEYRFYTWEELLEETQQVIVQATHPSRSIFNYENWLEE